MLTPLHDVPTDAAGQLAVMPRPRGGDWLSEEVSNWRSRGVTRVVSALTTSEIAELGLTAEESLCNEAGIAYQCFPIEDRSVPRDLAAFLCLAKEINSWVSQGEFVAVHCRMGIGRSGTIAAAVLVLRGATVTEAFDIISQARGLQVPDTPGQVDWLRQGMKHRA